MAIQSADDSIQPSTILGKLGSPRIKRNGNALLAAWLLATTSLTALPVEAFAGAGRGMPASNHTHGATVTTQSLNMSELQRVTAPSAGMSVVTPSAMKRSIATAPNFPKNGVLRGAQPSNQPLNVIWASDGGAYAVDDNGNPVINPTANISNFNAPYLRQVRGYSDAQIQDVVKKNVGWQHFTTDENGKIFKREPVTPNSPYWPKNPQGTIPPVNPYPPVGPQKGQPQSPRVEYPVSPYSPISPKSPYKPIQPIGGVSPLSPVGPIHPISPVSPKIHRAKFRRHHHFFTATAAATAASNTIVIPNGSVSPVPESGVIESVPMNGGQVTTTTTPGVPHLPSTTPFSSSPKAGTQGAGGNHGTITHGGVGEVISHGWQKCVDWCTWLIQTGKSLTAIEAEQANQGKTLIAIKTGQTDQGKILNAIKEGIIGLNKGGTAATSAIGNGFDRLANIGGTIISQINHSQKKQDNTNFLIIGFGSAIVVLLTLLTGIVLLRGRDDWREPPLTGGTPGGYPPGGPGGWRRRWGFWRSSNRAATAPTDLALKSSTLNGFSEQRDPEYAAILQQQLDARQATALNISKVTPVPFTNEQILQDRGQAVDFSQLGIKFVEPKGQFGQAVDEKIEKLSGVKTAAFQALKSGITNLREATRPLRQPSRDMAPQYGND